MLRCMGIMCVRGTGEAESMCAYLNQDGLVDGCISQDSDCFAYGAKIVYRNFSISHQGAYAASGGAVDIYDIEKANEQLNFGRNKIIALALLCGSDYNDGVKGVGKDSALKFMNKYKDQDVLDRMRSWRSKDSLFLELENKINNKNICSSCGHSGKVQAHSKNGCGTCATTKGCDFTKFREERLEIKNELQIRNKALLDPNFPNEALINEYLVKKDTVQHLDLKWRQPDLVNFVKFTVKFLGWEELYAFEKLLPILTRWLLKNHKIVAGKVERNSISEIKGIIFPKYIKKSRNPKGIPSYEIIWEDRNKYFEHLIPEEQIEEYLESKKNDVECLWTTIEPKHLVEYAYPNLVQEFLDRKGKKGSKPRKRVKNPENIDDLTSKLLNTSLTSPEPKKPKGRPKKTIDAFFPKKKQNQLLEKPLNLSFDPNCSKFDDSDSDLSDIVDQITRKSPKLPEKIKKLGFVYKSATFEQNKTVDSEETEENRSCFFETNYDREDLFEKTFENRLETDESEKEDSFDDIYISLLDRIKNTINT